MDLDFFNIENYLYSLCNKFCYNFSFNVTMLKWSTAKKPSPTCLGFLQGKENDNISYFQIYTVQVEMQQLHSTSNIETWPRIHMNHIFQFHIWGPNLDSSSHITAFTSLFHLDFSLSLSLH